MRPGPLDDRAAWRIHGFTGEPAELTADRTLPRAWTARWAAAPDIPVLKDARTPWITAEDLEARTAQAAGRLAALGVGVGDRVLMSCDPSVDLVVAHVGALRLGAIVVPVNTGFGPAELGNVWREARPVVALLDDPARLPDAPVRPPSLDGVGPVSVPLDQSDTDDPAMLMFTSGHDGTPQGRAPQPRQRARECRRRAHRMALDGRRPSCVDAPALPHARPRRRRARHAARRRERGHRPVQS